MVDFNAMFKKLANETPEERVARAEQRDREHEEWVGQRIREKSVLIDSCITHRLARSPKEEEFLAQLQHKAASVSCLHGIRGGDLLGLSDAQVGWLKDIASRVPQHRSPPGAVADAAATPMTRAQRYRGRGG
jgi:hypothetical protein